MNIRLQERFGEVVFVACSLISVDLDGVNCDQVARDSSKFDIEEPATRLGGVSFDVVARDLSKCST